MTKKVSKKTVLLSIILVAIAGFTLHFFYNGYVATAGSQQQELDRLFGNMGILKIPHATQPVEIQLREWGRCNGCK